MQSKQQHDLKMAQMRPISFTKPWYRAAREGLKKLNWQGGDALNLCCGNNEFSIILRDEFQAHVWAADIVPDSVEHAAADGFESFIINIDDTQSRAQAAKKYEEKFDLIVSTAAIEHIFDTNGFFSFCHQVLKKGGLLLLTTPNMSFIGNRIYFELQGGTPLNANSHHITFWSYKALYVFFCCYGFTDISDESRYYSERYTTSRLQYLVGGKLKSVMERIYDWCGRYESSPRFKSLVTSELVVIGRKTKEATFYFPFTLLNLDAMPEPERRELLERCVDMDEEKALKQHPGCYRIFLKLREQMK